MFSFMSTTTHVQCCFSLRPAGFLPEPDVDNNDGEKNLAVSESQCPEAKLKGYGPIIWGFTLYIASGQEQL